MGGKAGGEPGHSAATPSSEGIEDQAMLEWMMTLLVVAIIIVAVLAYFEAIDLGELIGGVLMLVGEVLRLIVALLLAVGAFFVWLVKRRRSEKQP
jgi:hypothetical protein